MFDNIIDTSSRRNDSSLEPKTALAKAAMTMNPFKG